MYQELFTNNFILNFLNTFLFIFFNILFSFSVSFKLNKNQITFFKEFQSIVIFYIIFVLYSFLFNVLILFDKHKYFDLVFYLTLLVQIIFFIKNINFFKNYNFKKYFKQINNTKKFIIFFSFIFFLISILPISDADSIALHQNLANTIYLDGFKNIDLNKNVAFLIFSNTQNLLIISPILNSDNFGSQLNLIVLVFFIFYNFKDHKKFSLILFSSPLLIYFISTQKLQLFFGILYLLLFIIIKKDLIKNKLGLFILVFLLVFYSSGNLSYLLFSIPLYFYLFAKFQKSWKLIILFSLISFIIILFPVFLIKQIYFKNIFAPFFDNMFGENNSLYNSYALDVRGSGGWIRDPSNILLYLKPFISFNVREFSSSLGIIFLLMIFNIELLKKTNFFPIIIFLIVFSTGQLLPRYYFEAFLILAYYASLNDIISKLIVYFFNLIILIIAITFTYISYIDEGVISDKKNYMNRFSYSYYNSKQYKNFEFKGNILDYSLTRPSIFFNQNIYSGRTLMLLNKDKKQSSEFVKKNFIEYIISDKIEHLPSCIALYKVAEINNRLVTRNFLKKFNSTRVNLYKVKSNNC